MEYFTTNNRFFLMLIFSLLSMVSYQSKAQLIDSNQEIELILLEDDRAPAAVKKASSDEDDETAPLRSGERVYKVKLSIDQGRRFYKLDSNGNPEMHNGQPRAAGVLGKEFNGKEVMAYRKPNGMWVVVGEYDAEGKVKPSQLQGAAFRPYSKEASIIPRSEQTQALTMGRRMAQVIKQPDWSFNPAKPVKSVPIDFLSDKEKWNEYKKSGFKEAKPVDSASVTTGTRGLKILKPSKELGALPFDTTGNIRVDCIGLKGRGDNLPKACIDALKDLNPAKQAGNFLHYAKKFNLPDQKKMTADELQKEMEKRFGPGVSQELVQKYGGDLIASEIKKNNDSKPGEIKKASTTEVKSPETEAEIKKAIDKDWLKLSAQDRDKIDKKCKEVSAKAKAGSATDKKYHENVCKNLQNSLLNEMKLCQSKITPENIGSQIAERRCIILLNSGCFTALKIKDEKLCPKAKLARDYLKRKCENESSSTKNEDRVACAAIRSDLGISIQANNSAQIPQPAIKAEPSPEATGEESEDAEDNNVSE